MEKLIGRDTYQNARTQTEELIATLAHSKAPWFREKVTELQNNLNRFDQRWVDTAADAGGPGAARTLLEVMRPLCVGARNQYLLVLSSVAAWRAQGNNVKAQEELRNLIGRADLPVDLNGPVLLERAELEYAAGNAPEACDLLERILAQNKPGAVVPAAVAELAAKLGNQQLVKAAAERAGCVLHLTFNKETLQSTAEELQIRNLGNSQTTVMVVGATPATSDRRQCLKFDGVNDYAYIEDPILKNTNTVTFAAWIRPTNTKKISGIILDRLDPETAWGLNLATDGKLHYHWKNKRDDCSDWAGGPTVPPNEWSFVALTVEPDAGNVYVGIDELVRATNKAPQPPATLARLRIGSDGNVSARRFPGWIDELWIFNRALSSAEVETLYRASDERAAKAAAR